MWIFSPGDPGALAVRTFRGGYGFGRIASQGRICYAPGMRFRIHVALKNGVHDPQGEAAHRVLKRNGMEAFKDVRIGKFIDVEVDAENPEKAKALVETASKELFANTVIERYWIEGLST